MKRLTIICAMVAVVLLSGCVHNNGDIGDWFGMWKIERITIDGEDDPEYKSDAFIAFQSTVFMVRVSYPEISSGYQYMGRWSEGEGKLTLEFNTKESAVPSEHLHLHFKKDNILQVLQRGGGRKTLQLVAEDGKTYTYYLKSW